MTPKRKKGIFIAACATSLLTFSGGLFIKTHPLVFNESFLEHAHCIARSSLAFRFYAEHHDGRFPFHTNGYGDALLLINDGDDSVLTGPGYNTKVFTRARQSGEDAPESEFGRVYVQGLRETNDPRIVLLFDKLPTPGGDHCHGLRRLFRPLAREVCFLDGGHRTIPESEWPVFAKQQIELLVAAGIERKRAEEYYAEKPNR